MKSLVIPVAALMLGCAALQATAADQPLTRSQAQLAIVFSLSDCAVYGAFIPSRVCGILECGAFLDHRPRDGAGFPALILPPLHSSCVGLHGVG